MVTDEKYLFMECNQIKEKLIFLAEGSLNPDQEMHVHNHLKRCNDCQTFYHHVRSVLSVIEKEKIKEHNSYFSMKVMNKLKGAAKPGITPGLFSFPSIAKPLFASLLIGSAIYTGIILGRNFSIKSNYSSDNLRTSELQSVADEFYLNDFEIENIETILITQNNQ
jgi:hypothetical protein